MAIGQRVLKTQPGGGRSGEGTGRPRQKEDGSARKKRSEKGSFRTGAQKIRPQTGSACACSESAGEEAGTAAERSQGTGRLGAAEEDAGPETCGPTVSGTEKGSG